VDAREAANHVLSWLDAQHDEAAVFSFDTRLDLIAPFTGKLEHLPATLSALEPFGATSLHDAIAQTAEELEDRSGRRRAVVVFTDGNDNASRLKPNEVSAIASAIDVPVYILGVVPSIDNPLTEFVAGSRPSVWQALTDLAQWTGGKAFIVSTPAQRSIAAREVVDELRHQYFMAFEASDRPGWRPLVVRARDRNLTVRARSGYFAGPSGPTSQ
jgi:VWFA-related protein